MLDEEDLWQSNTDRAKAAIDVSVVKLLLTPLRLNPLPPPNYFLLLIFVFTMWRLEFSRGSLMGKRGWGRKNDIVRATLNIACLTTRLKVNALLQ